MQKTEKVCYYQYDRSAYFLARNLKPDGNVLINHRSNCSGPHAIVI